MHNRLNILRRLAHDRLTAGELPFHRAESIVQDAGSGEPCALCGAPITFDEIVAETLTSMGEERLRFHRACHAVWLEESSNLQGRGRAPAAEH